MPQAPDIRFDVATAMWRGKRDYQEDAVAADFPSRGEVCFAVLSDGMGGHAAGDIASKIVVTEVFSELKFQTGDPKNFLANRSDILRDAALAANECLRAHTQSNPETDGMGATLVAPVVFGAELFWISIGDSPLYLFRDGELKQLNEDHSLAPQIDLMVNRGLIAAEIGRNHPDRNCLTSVLIGDGIERIDCPDRPFDLRDGDLIIAASDGLQSLSDEEIAKALKDVTNLESHAIADHLLDLMEDRDDPNQDNVTLCVIGVQMTEAHKRARPKRPTGRRRSAEIVPLSRASAREGADKAKA